MNPLHRALRNLVLFMIVLAALLFGPAWSLGFGEAWLYLALLGVLSVAITLYLAAYDPALLQRRLRAGPGAERETLQKVVVAIASMMVGALMVVASLDHRGHWSTVPKPLVVVGDLGFVASYIIVFLVFRANSFTSGVVEVTSGQRVVSSGPYALVRHPMYSGAFLFLLATPLALASWWALIPAVAACAAIVVRLLNEEKFLAQHLDGYQTYRGRVRWRLVPGIW
jgi:protein-S-isoprenylcysteine O-methyltransferase Ste14